MTANAPNKAHAQTKFVKDFLEQVRLVSKLLDDPKSDPKIKFLHAPSLKSFPSDWLLSCSVDLFICFPKQYF